MKHSAGNRKNSAVALSSLCLAVLVLSVSALLTGCALTGTAPSAPIGTPVGNLQGVVHGGRSPVVGANVYLYQPSTNGYGGANIAASALNASASLLDSKVPSVCGTSGTSACKDANGNYYVSTDANGGFSVTGDYTCTANLPVYIYALGGNAGAGVSPSAGFLSILGICPASGSLASQVPSINVNELSTVAAAYATAGFATDPTHIGVLVQQTAPASLTSTLASLQTLETTGLNNAFLTAGNLYNPVAGGSAVATTPGGNGTVPYQTINVLGNILAGCINTAGASAYCTMFLGYTPGATDTAGAAIYIAQHPASNVANIFGLASGIGAPWLPALSSAPNDWTMSISYAVPGAGIGNYASHQVAADADGNIWVSGASTANQLAAVNNLGVPLAGSPFSGNGLSVPTNIAVDAASANVWVVDYTSNSLSEFTTAGAAVQTVTPYSSGTTDALSSPTDVVFDNAGDLWVNNYDNGSSSLVKLTSAGTFTATGSSSSYLKGGEGLAAETNGSIFAVSYSSKYIALFTNADAYSAELSTTYVSNGIAIDASGNAWVANSEKYIYKVNSTNTADTKITANGSTYYIPEFFGVAIDGGGNVWLPDWSNGVIEELNNSGTVVSGTYGFEPAETVSYTPSGSTAPPTGYFEPYNTAVDGSGNVWFNSKTVAGVLQEMVGAATPVVTPLAYGVKNSLLGTAP
jgi:hypothetical protein